MEKNMQIYQTRRLLLDGGLIALALLTSGLMVMWSTQQVLSTTAGIVYSNQVFTKLDEFPFHLADAAAAYRDFILTGEEQTLEPYQTATAAARQNLVELQTLVAHSPEQQQRVESLRALLGECLQRIQQMQQIRRDEGGEAALAVLATDAGSDSVEQMR